MKSFFAVSALGATVAAINLQTGSEPLPVTVIESIDGTFDVYSNVCGFNIFESRPKIVIEDSYEWSGPDLIVYSTLYGFRAYPKIFAAETEDQDCDAYNKPDAKDYLFDPPVMTLFLDEYDRTNFTVWSFMCDMYVWDYQPGDTFSWNGGVLEVERSGVIEVEGVNVAHFEFPPENRYVDTDCDAYLTNLGIPVFYALEVTEKTSGIFEIYSQVCEVVAFTSAPGDSYSWVGEVIRVTDEGGISTDYYALESTLMDCSVYDLFTTA